MGELTHEPRPGLPTQQGRQHRSCETGVGRQGRGPCKGTLPTTEGGDESHNNLALLIMCRTTKYAFTVVHHYIHLLLSFFFLKIDYFVEHLLLPNI